VESVDVRLPQAGEIFDAKVTKLGMTVASEVFGDAAENPTQPVLMVFFETEEGVKGNSPMGFYKVPSPRTHLYQFVRKYGQPKVGMTVKIDRNDKGYWGIAL